MTVLIILLVLALLVIALLFLDISLVFEYKERFKFKIKILCFSIGADKLVKLAEEREELTEKKPETTKRKRKKTPSDILDDISYISGIIKAVLGEFFRYARLKLCKVKITVATEDAAKTALIYGVASSALYTALEFLDSFITVKKNYKNVGVAADFSSDECTLDLKVILKLKIIHLLLAFIHVSPSLVRTKKGI